MSADSFLLSAGIAGDWPHGRGCYISEDKQFIILTIYFSKESIIKEENKI